MAAWEALFHVRRLIPGMNRGAFLFYPGHTPEGDVAFAPTYPGEDIAVLHLIHYLAAQHDLVEQPADF